MKDIAKKVGIEKRVNSHSFRHSRATHLASKLTESQMQEYFGWVQGSKMAFVYVYMSGRDIDNAILRINGIIPERDKEKELAVKVCPMCNEKNSPNYQYCRRCGSPLTEESELLKLLSKPDVLNFLVEKLAETMKK